MVTTTFPPDLKKVTERNVRYLRDKPITFEEFLDMFGPKDFVELVEGAIVEKPMVQWDHKRLLLWLIAIAQYYVDENDLGVVAGSRTAVNISLYGGRLPDFLFVRKDRLGIIQQKAIYGPPDLIIELRSPSNTNSEVVALESEYRNIGVSEIVFIDQKKRSVRVIRKRGADYEEFTLTEGVLRFESFDGFWLRIEWLFNEPRTTVPQALADISHGSGED